MPKFLLALSVVLIVISGCSKEEVKVEDQPIGVEAYKYVMPKDGKVTHPVFGKERWFAYGAMGGVGETPANGVVQGQYFADGTFALTMQINIQLPEDGTFYEVWMLGEDQTDIVSAGHLANHFGDARHQLNFTSEEDLRLFPLLRVTLEADDGDPDPSQQLVAQGLLQPRRR